VGQEDGDQVAVGAEDGVASLVARGDFVQGGEASGCCPGAAWGLADRGEDPPVQAAGSVNPSASRRRSSGVIGTPAAVASGITDWRQRSAGLV
jgi:hypothetical protein